MIIKDTIQLFSFNPVDYDEFVRVMIEVISCHSIVVPITKEHNPIFPLCLLTKSFERFHVLDDCIEVFITDDDKIVKSPNIYFSEQLDLRKIQKGSWLKNPHLINFKSF